MSFRVLVSRRAERDIREIRDWIRGRSTAGAVSWTNALEMVIRSLPQRATTSTAAAEAEGLGVDLRQRLFKTRRGNPYRLVFVIRLDVIHVLAVRGTGQDLLLPGEIDIPE